MDGWIGEGGKGEGGGFVEMLAQASDKPNLWFLRRLFGLFRIMIHTDARDPGCRMNGEFNVF